MFRLTMAANPLLSLFQWVAAKPHPQWGGTFALAYGEDRSAQIVCDGLIGSADEYVRLHFEQAAQQLKARQ